MEHLAILSKKRKLLNKILTGEKTIESRWYKSKKAPFGNISSGDIVYFKESGCPVSVKARVKNAITYKNLNHVMINQIIKEYGKYIGVDLEFAKEVEDKKICILVFLDNPKKIEPFEIDKTGYGLMSAWIVVEDIRDLEK